MEIRKLTACCGRLLKISAVQVGLVLIAATCTSDPIAQTPNEAAATAAATSTPTRAATAAPPTAELAGVLLNGQTFTVVSTPPLDYQDEGVFGVITVDLDDGEIPIEGPVLGIITYHRVDGPHVPGSASDVPGFDERTRTLVVVSGDWYMKVQIYSEVAFALGEDYGSIVQDAIRPIKSGGDRAGLPAFELAPPLRWTNDNEIPAAMMVQFADFAILRGCRDVAITCSPDGAVQVVPIDTVAGPPRAWPDSQVEIFGS